MLQIKYRWMAYRHLPPKRKENLKMSATILQALFMLGAIFGIAFMVLCTVFVVICIVHGDIKISIVRNGAGNTKK